MPKFFTYLIIVSGMMLLFWAAGFNTLTGKIFTLTIDNISSFGSYWFWGLIVATIGLLAASGAKISIFGSGFTFSSTTAKAAIGAVAFFAFIGDLISLTIQAKASIGTFGYLVGLIMIPLIYGYAQAIVDWVSGALD